MPQPQPNKVKSASGRTWQLERDALTRSDDNGSTSVPVNRAAAEARGHAPVSRNAQYWSVIAPWYPLFVLVLGLLVSIDEVVPVTHKAIAPEGKSDTPLQPGEPDALELTAIASGLALFLRNDKTRPPLVIAVNGRWGSGKSSLMNLVRAQLEAAGSRPVWFNAWHHQKEDQLLAALLDAVKKQAVPTVGSRPGFMFRVRLAWARLRQSWFEASLAVAAVVLLWQAESYLKLNHEAYSVGHLLHQMFGSLFGPGTLESGQLKDLLETTDKWIATGGAVIFALTRAMRGIRAFASDPSSLLAGDAPATSAKRLQAQTAFRQRFAQEFADVTRALGAQRMLIVIDDLDRCRPEKVREVLESVNFLVSSGECFVILGMAREIVRHCVGLSFSRVVDTMPWEAFDLPAEDIERVLRDARTSFGMPTRGRKRPNVTVAAKRAAFAELFLDKLVQIEISIPEPTPQQKAQLFATAQAEAEQRAARWLKIGSSVTDVLQPLVCATLVAFAVIASGFQVGQRFDSLWPVADATDLPVRQDIDAEAQSGAGVPAEGLSPTNNDGEAANPNNGRGAASSGLGVSSSKPGVPAYLTAGAAMPVRWYSSWPFGLAVLALAAAGLGALRRVPQQPVADSAAFAKAITKWHPIVLTEGARNTPRTARRFQNRVRYLAMRQRALEEGPQFSPAERLVRSLIGVKSGKPAPLMRLDDKQSTPYEQWKQTRESGLERPVYIPEETLVALAAIHQFEPEWVRDEEQFKRHVVDGTDSTSHALAAALKELPDAQRPHLRTYREAYLRLSSDVDQPIAAPVSAPATASTSKSASPMPHAGGAQV
jgi:KAP-like P-loop domain-containing protein